MPVVLSNAINETDVGGYGFQNRVPSVKPVFQFWEKPKPVFGFDFGSHIGLIAFTANLQGWGVEVKDGTDRTVCSAGNVQVATGNRGVRC